MVWVFILTVVLIAGCEGQDRDARIKMDVKEFVGMKGCPYCHDMRRKLLGPSFYSISERYREEDREKLIESLLKGSNGKWGDSAMPPQKLTDEEARIIVEWILRLKYELK